MKQIINKTITHTYTQEGLLNVYIFVLKQIQANKQRKRIGKMNRRKQKQTVSGVRNNTKKAEASSGTK